MAAPMDNTSQSSSTQLATTEPTHNATITTTEPPDQCLNGSAIIWNSLEMCLENAFQYIAFISAILSLFFWLISHLFLLRARHLEGNSSRRQFLTLIHVFFANLCNLIGAALTDQLGTQVLIAGYFIASDAVFFLHFLYVYCTAKRRQTDRIPYNIYNPPGEWKSPDRVRTKQNGNRTRLTCILLTWLPAAVYVHYASSSWQQKTTNFGPGRKLLMVGESSVDNFGYTLGVFAVLAYGLAKVPLVQDGLRHSDYLLRHFHVINFATLANLCYALSVLLYTQSIDYVVNALPWLLICGVCTLFDVIVQYQIAYRHRQLARERLADRWNESRDPSVRQYEDNGLQDGDEGWMPQQQPRLSPIDEDDERDDSDESLILRDHPHRTPVLVYKKQPHHTQVDMTYSDTERADGNQSPIQALPPPPQHPRGGRKQKMEKKERAENSADDLEWDLSDMSKTYKDDDDLDNEEEDEEIIWDEDVIRKEVEAELRRREMGLDEDGGLHDDSDISVESLEFEEIPVNSDVTDEMNPEWFDTVTS